MVVWLFLPFAATKSTDRNTYEQVICEKYVFVSLGWTVKIRITGAWGNSMSNILRNSQTISQEADLFTLLSVMYEASNFFKSWAAQLSLLLLLHPQ